MKCRIEINSIVSLLDSRDTTAHYLLTEQREPILDQALLDCGLEDNSLASDSPVGLSLLGLNDLQSEQETFEIVSPSGKIISYQILGIYSAEEFKKYYQRSKQRHLEKTI